MAVLLFTRYPVVSIGIIIVSILFALRFKIFNLASKLKIDIQEVQIVPSELHPGDQARCQVKFQTKSPVYLDQIAASISAREHATSGYGTRSQSYSYTVYEKQYIKPYGEELAAGRWVTYECLLPIPADAPPIFKANNNMVMWFVQLKITYKGWPSWQRTIPIIVSPR